MSADLLRQHDEENRGQNWAAVDRASRATDRDLRQHLIAAGLLVPAEQSTLDAQRAETASAGKPCLTLDGLARRAIRREAN